MKFNLSNKIIKSLVINNIKNTLNIHCCFIKQRTNLYNKFKITQYHLNINIMGNLLDGD